MQCSVTAEARVIERTNLAVGAATVEVSFDQGRYGLPRDVYRKWIQTAANSVARYFRKFPVKKVSVRIESTSGDSVAFSTADFEGETGVIEIPVGDSISENDLLKSWEATHEMVHLGFPLVDRDNKWVAEGMATYIEPIARMQVKDMTPDTVWGDLVDNLPRGFRENSRGLKNAYGVDALYWGGAAYCLLADIEIRKRTQNRLGLQDALAAIAAQGGNIHSDLEVPDALALGDKATGVDVLLPLYQRVHTQRFVVDLPSLWKQLGVRKVGSKTVFDDTAPLASVRKAINEGRTSIAGNRVGSNP